jgi:molecular chaperone GrpE
MKSKKPKVTLDEKKTSQVDKHKVKEDPVAEMRELLQRTQAQFENFRKQTDKRTQETHKMAARDIITQLLPIIDTFELALNNTTNHKEFVQGIGLIHSQLISLLQDNDVDRIDALHKPFNPQEHEALMKIPSDEEENIVLEEFAHGYSMHGVVIRHAKVKVSSGNKNKEHEKDSETHLKDE